jgi:hypothetical protein
MFSPSMSEIVIGTPCGSSLVHAGFATSMAAMAAKLAGDGIHVRVLYNQGWEVGTQRDLLTDLFINETKASHILFVDSDMIFGPDLYSLLLAFKKDVVGAACPVRHLDLNKVRDGVQAGKSFERAWLDAHRFACDKPLRQGGPLIEVERLGFGFTLVARNVFDKMTGECNLRRYRDKNANQKSKRSLLGFFDRIDQPDGGRLAEDYAFCERWRQIGGQLWVDATANIKHVIDFPIGVPLMTVLRKDEK